jgi:hypothetical protein
MKITCATPAPIVRDTIYRGKAIHRLFPSGYCEIYSDQQGCFLKFDRKEAAKQAIRDDLACKRPVGSI